MIDVLIVLLIFLLLTTTFRQEAGLKIRLPQANTPSVAREGALVVNIDASGRIQINGRFVDDPTDDKLLAAFVDAGPNRDAAVVIRADRNTLHQRVMSVLGASGKAGLTRVTFAVDNPPPGP
jgi:biopolymer transport protein ExbD